jgi:NAD(P)-dependent dehydrogenase (short-subunit alcohol dehydrogenase family)
MTAGAHGRIAVVTGGARGIGRACVLALAETGHAVAALDLDEPDSEHARVLLAAVAQTPGTACYLQADVTSRDAVEAAMAAVRDRLGTPSILINNAGKGRTPVALEDLADGDWDAIVALNLRAAMVCSRALIPAMKAAGWGRVVNISSIAGRGRGESAHIAYASAKAGVLGFTRQLACEVGPFGVTVNAVAPGAILSGRVATRWAERDEGARSKMTEVIPLRRIGQPDEVARAVRFLASDDASYITGATLDVNGGRYF